MFHMTRTHLKSSAAIALAAAVGLSSSVFAATAQAQSPSPASFSSAQLLLEHQIIARQVQLATLGTEVADAANVTTSDRAALTTLLTNEQGALATDATNAAAATTTAQLASVRQAMYVDERVYVVVTSQVNLVRAADNDTVTEAGYTSLVSELEPMVNELSSQYATALLGNITSEVSAATSLTTGVSAGALALTPAGYPGNQSQIRTYSYQLGQVSKDLATAQRDVNKIERVAQDMHGLHPAKRFRSGKRSHRHS